MLEDAGSAAFVTNCCFLPPCEYNRFPICRMQKNIDLRRGIKTALISGFIGLLIPLAIVFWDYATNYFGIEGDDSQIDWNIAAGIGFSFFGCTAAFLMTGFASSTPKNGVPFPASICWIGGSMFIASIAMPIKIPRNDGLEISWSIFDATPFAVSLAAMVGVLLYGIHCSKNITAESST